MNLKVITEVLRWLMTIQQKAGKIAELLKKRYPNPAIPLKHSTAYELLFATILSAQSTDSRVNQITPTLFAKYPTLEAFANADLDELKQIIKPIGLYNTKANNIQNAARKLIADFGGQVPNKMEDLITLPGVSRKTASVVIWQWFGENQGFTVDTHVIRLSRWFGLTVHSDPKKIEMDLMQLFPQSEWGNMSLRLILLGRELLTARNPKYKDTEWESLLNIE